MVKLVPRGSPFNPAALSVVSYNLLAPLYVRPLDARTGCVQAFAAFQWAEPADEVLDWDVRRPRLLKELESCGADVICLQEVQFDDSGNGEFSLPKWLQLPDYLFRVPPARELLAIANRNRRVLGSRSAVGNAVLYRTDRLSLVEQRGTGGKDQLQGVGVCVRGQPGSALAALGPTAVLSVHLDATSEEKRVRQLSKCLERARQLGTREVIIAGDLNTEMWSGSCVEAFVAGGEEPTEEELERECASALRLTSAGEGEGEGSEAGDGEADGEDVAAGAATGAAEANGGGREGGGKRERSSDEGGGGGGGGGGGDDDASDTGGNPSPTAEQLEAWRQLRVAAREASAEHRIWLSRVPTGATRSAWPHGQEGPPCGAWRLDHILHSARTLQADTAWEALEADAAAARDGLPNRACPSDHLPVGAAFMVTPPPALPAEASRALAARVVSLTRAQATERAALAEELGALQAALAEEQAAQAAAAPPAEAPVVASAPKGKAKGKGKAKTQPSEAEITLLRARRERERELKAAHREQRVGFVSGLAELELDELECWVGPSEWDERGAEAAGVDALLKAAP